MRCHSVPLWYTKPDDAVDYAKFFSRSHDAVIRVYDDAGNVIQTHEARAISKIGECLPLKLDVQGFFTQSDQGL